MDENCFNQILKELENSDKNLMNENQMKRKKIDD